jgi:hypothetical protein
MTLLDYGLPGVKLDSSKYYDAFMNTSHFKQPGEINWMLWSPPKSVVRPDEWQEMRESRKSRKSRSMVGVSPSQSAFSALVLLQLIADSSISFKQGARDAFMATVEHINDGELEVLEDSMHRSCYNYTKGWLAYMKEQGYTWKHTIEKVESVDPESLSTFMMFQSADEFDLAGPYEDFVHWSKFGKARSVRSASYFNWVKFTVKEKFEVMDSKGSLIMATPIKTGRHVWKFGSTVSFEEGEEELMLRQDLQMPYKLYDMDHQVILRAANILSEDKLFLDGDASRHEVWQMTCAME